jgi:hypothetical protein
MRENYIFPNKGWGDRKSCQTKTGYQENNGDVGIFIGMTMKSLQIQFFTLLLHKKEY